MLALHLTALLLVVPSEMKCPSPAMAMPGYEWREPIILVDGVITGRYQQPQSELQADQVAYIGITCWDPATDTFERDGIPVIRIQTKAMNEATRAPLLELIRAQEEFRARHDRYAMDLEALVEFGFDPDAALEFEASESGWRASTPSGPVAYRCSATEVSAESAGEDGEPQLDCALVDTLALRTLRARYDAGR